MSIVNINGVLDLINGDVAINFWQKREMAPNTYIPDMREKSSPATAVRLSGTELPILLLLYMVRITG